MSGFWRCACYIAATGIFSFFLGRILPKKWFMAEKFPYKEYRFEQGGKFYERLQIHKWQNKVPDMSKIVPSLMPPKKLTGDYEEKLPRMIEETCVAEFIHGLLCFSGLACIGLWQGIGGWVVSLINIALFNLPFVLIQRYNRPRLGKLMRKRKERRERVQCES